MPLGAPEFTELFATTLEKYESELVDNVLTKHPFLDLLKDKAASDTGRSLVLPLEAANLDRTGVTDASGTFSTAVDPSIIGAAVYDWSDPIVTPTRVVYKELQQNSGKHQLIDLLKAHKNAAEKDHARYLATQAHVLAAAQTPGVFEPLDNIVNTTTVSGRINGATAPYWQSQRVTSNAVESNANHETIRKAFRRVSNDILQDTSNRHQVTHILAGRDVWEEYEDSFDDKVRYVEFGEGQTRFKAINFGDVEVRYDPDCPSDRAYFLDIDTWAFKFLNGNFMKVQPAQTITGTLDFVTPLASMLAIGTNERRANGVLIRDYTTI